MSLWLMRCGSSLYCGCQCRKITGWWLVRRKAKVSPWGSESRYIPSICLRSWPQTIMPMIVVYDRPVGGSGIRCMVDRGDSKAPHGDHFVHRLSACYALLLLSPHAFRGTLVSSSFSLSVCPSMVNASRLQNILSAKSRLQCILGLEIRAI